MKTLLSLSLLGFVLLGLFSCLSNPKEKTELQFQLDSTLVGKFDSVKVSLYPKGLDTGKTLFSKTFVLKPGQSTVQFDLPENVSPNFSAVITGLKDNAVAFEKRFDYAEKGQKRDSAVVDVKARKDSVILADSVAHQDSLAQVDRARTRLTAEDLDCQAGDTVNARVTVRPDTAADKEYSLHAVDTLRAGTRGHAVLCRDTGKVTIEVRAHRDTARMSFSVTITEKVILLSSISVSNLGAKTGDTVTVTPTLEPDGATDKGVQLIVADTTKAKVLSGLRLVALAAGSTQVTVQANRGSAKATFSFSISDKSIAPTALDAVDTTGLLYDTLTPNIVFMPSNATEREFEIASDDTTRVRVVGKRLALRAEGSAQVTVTATAGGAKDTFTVTVRGPTFADIQPISKKWCGKCHSPTITFNLQDSAVLVGRGSKALARLSLPFGNTAHMPADTTMDKRDLDLMLLWLGRNVKTVLSLSAKDTAIALGDTITPRVVFLPNDATNKNYTLESDNSAAIKPVGNRLVAGVLGSAKITVRAEDGDKTATFTAMAVTPQFDAHVKPITTEKCGKCHSPTITFNLQDSSVFLIKGAESLRRLQLAKTDKDRMPAEGDLTPSQLGILLGWLNAHFVPLQNVTVAEDTVRLGDTKFPKVTFAPGDASNKGYSLVSFDTTVTTPTGIRIHGAYVGSANVGLTTEEGAKSKSFKVTVIPWPVDSLVGADTSFQVGDTVIPQVGAFPEEATSKSYTLTSLGLGVTVLPGGKVTASALGSVKIVATSVQNPTVKDTFTVVVGPVPVQSVSAANLSLFVGSTKAPTLSWTPSSATNKGYTLSLVSGTGATLVGTTQLSGTAAGNSVWRVTSTDGAKTANFNVTVGNVVATGIALTLPRLVVGTTVQSTAVFAPDSTTLKTYALTSSNPAVLKVVSSTQVQVLKMITGTTTITATATDGPIHALARNTVLPPFNSGVSTVLNTYCLTCHGPGKVNATAVCDSTTVADSLTRSKVYDRINRPFLSAGYMPASGVQLTPTELATLNAWFKWGTPPN